jgi:hypothetical protein
MSTGITGIQTSTNSMTYSEQERIRATSRARFEPKQAPFRFRDYFNALLDIFP